MESTIAVDLLVVGLLRRHGGPNHGSGPALSLRSGLGSGPGGAEQQLGLSGHNHL